MIENLMDTMNELKMLIVIPAQAASLPLSIIIVGVGPAEFDGKCSIIWFLFFTLVCINTMAEG